MNLLSPLSLFIIASFAIHASVVMISNNTTTMILPGTTGSSLSIKIKEVVIRPQRDKKPVTPKVQQIKKATSHSKDNEKEKLTKQSTKPKITPSPAQITKKSEARVISIIYKELSQYFTYPKLAQKRNWQGKVLLSLRLSSSGKIKEIQLNNSSGYSVLDQAAIVALRKVDQLPNISKWLDHDIELELPVIYKLTEG